MARGSIYRPTYRAADGTKKRQAVYWLAWYQEGKLRRRSSGTMVRSEADKQLRALMKSADDGAPLEPTATVTLTTLQRLVENDYRTNGRRSLREVTRSFGLLTEHFGASTPASSIKVAAVQNYVDARLRTAQPGTVNRELASLRRGFRLAVKGELLARRPDFSLLTLHNARRGFFEDDDFEQVLRHLPDYLQPLMRFLKLTGWRSSEARGLEWQHVKDGVIRIEDSKNREARTLPYRALPALEQVIESQRRRKEALAKPRLEGRRRVPARIVRHVFFTARGFKIHDYQVEWKAACKAAGLAGRIVHDFRRTAARNMLRAGIPQKVAMDIGGWKTDSVFRRYAITDEAMIAENLKKLADTRSGS